MSKTALIRLGLFVFIGSLLLIITIFTIGNKESLFTPTFNVRAYFTNTEGLRSGSQVRLSGIGVGSVTDIKIVQDSVGKVEVVMRLNHEISPFIKSDTRASIETEGLVGNKVIVLTVGSSAAPQVQDGGVIIGVDPLGFGAIILETKEMLTYTKDLTKSLSEIVEKVNQGDGSVGKLINKDDLYQNTNRLLVTAERSLNTITSNLDTLAGVVNSLSGGVESVVSNVDQVIFNINEVINNVNDGKGLLGRLISEKSNYDSSAAQILANLIMISEETRVGASRFSENMEALKRNWLFKSYFDQRGYYDKLETENKFNDYINEIDKKLNMLNDRIDALKRLEERAAQKEKKAKE
ncbi:MAG: MCE family protein [Ignavibacteriaceae bacterium]|nr:MCE family protein [Ignavibacteriaceae bacterium]HRI47349.1 MlaD family protein [Ignavibacteriaceae bacterium]